MATPKPINYRITTYTREQKIIAAVWHHERIFTGMSRKQLRQNFLIRFNIKYPKHTTLRRWEQQLFRDGYLPNKPDASKSKTSLGRLVYVPYVKESLVRYPDLTVKARARLLGIAENTLVSIFKKDLRESDLTNFKKVHLEKVSINDSNETEQELIIKNEVIDNKTETNNTVD